MKKKSKIILLIFIILFLIVGTIAGAFFYVKSQLNPTRSFLAGEICGDEQAPCEVTPFVVDEGAFGKSTLIKLENEGIIKNADLSYYYNRLFTGYAFAAGYFEIPHQIAADDGSSRDISLEEIMAFLADPANAHQDTVTISFAEGGILEEYARQIADATTVDYEELMAYWNDPDVISGYMHDYPFLTDDIFDTDVRYYLEGYLFPDTYEFFEFTDPDEITRRFLDRTNDIYSRYEDDFASSPYSVHEVFTLASIVQGETGNTADAPLVAGVFVDRLEAPEVLASSVTSCYAFDLSKAECNEFGESVEYTQQYHPYNTYTIQGFPPGPVCNPNEISIAAALHPDTSEGYFYFVADLCNGGTRFARTLSEHNYNIETYYLACMP